VYPIEKKKSFQDLISKEKVMKLNKKTKIKVFFLDKKNFIVLFLREK
jgi:hypothetical protein